MTASITISGDKTLGEEHSGMKIVVNTTATVTLPHEDTFRFIKGDEFVIISNTDHTVSVQGEQNVTVIPISTASLTSKGSAVNIMYEGNNTYLMWGN